MNAEPDMPPAAVEKKPGMVVFQLPEQTLKGLAARMPDGVNVLICPPESFLPEFIRLPATGKSCHVTSLPRSTLQDLLQRAGSKVKTHSLRRPGSLKGPVLIHRASLIDYINNQPAPDWSTEAEDHG